VKKRLRGRIFWRDSRALSCVTVRVFAGPALPAALDVWGCIEKETKMQQTSALSNSSRLACFHKLCAWCGCDLGILSQHTEFPSYGICVPCAQQYFAHLYEADELVLAVPAARERVVGAAYVRLGT
jgi:hypothetical protein